MNRPLLQAALDHTVLSEALESARILAPELDVLEAGTILCYAEGVRAVESLAAAYPKHIVLADLKAADAGGTAAAQVFEGGIFRWNSTVIGVSITRRCGGASGSLRWCITSGGTTRRRGAAGAMRIWIRFAAWRRWDSRFR